MHLENSSSESETLRPISLLEIIGYLALIGYGVYFIYTFITSPFEINYQSFHSVINLILLLWWLMSCSIGLQFGRLLAQAIRSPKTITVDFPWFFSKNRLIDAKYLTTSKRIIIMVVALINPGFAGVIFNLIWRHSYLKARQANLIAFGALLIWIALWFVPF
jgi:hypothetical protein